MAGLVAAQQRIADNLLFVLIRKAGLYVLDMALVFLPLFTLYFFLRGLPTDRVGLATDNALRVISFEKSLFLFHEESWQEWARESPRLIELANFTYIHLHMPLLLVIGFVFLATDARKHRVLRNAILLSAFVAVPVYAAFPVTPPRLLVKSGEYAYNFVDTIPDKTRARPGGWANWYAAMPSYHFGWIFIAVAGCWWCYKSAIIRGAATAFAGLMWWAIVVTGNHYFLDMISGAIIVSGCFYLALHFERWADRNPEKVARFTVRVGELRLPF